MINVLFFTFSKSANINTKSKTHVVFNYYCFDRPKAEIKTQYFVSVSQINL